MIFHARKFEVGGAQIHFAGNEFKSLKIRRLDFFEQ